MAKIKISENKLKQMIKESVKKALNEDFNSVPEILRNDPSILSDDELKQCCRFLAANADEYTFSDNNQLVFDSYFDELKKRSSISEGINDFGYAVKTGARNAVDHISNTKGIVNKAKSGVDGFKRGYNAEQMHTKLSGAIKLISEIVFELKDKNVIDYKELVKYQNMWNAFDREITKLINSTK